MNPDEGEPTNRKKVSIIPEEIRNSVSNAVATAISADIASGRTAKGMVNVSNQDCVEYPCQYSQYWCCPCENSLCASVYQDGCNSFNYNYCGGGLCSSDSECIMTCEGMGQSCKSTP